MLFVVFIVKYSQLSISHIYLHRPMFVLGQTATVMPCNFIKGKENEEMPIFTHSQLSDHLKFLSSEPVLPQNLNTVRNGV